LRPLSFRSGSLGLTAIALLALDGQALLGQGPTATAPSPAPAASAQPPAPAPPKPPPPPWETFHADLGFVNTTGNTNVSTANAADALTVWTAKDNKINQDFGVTYGTITHRVETSLWTADLRDSYTLTPDIGFFGLVEFDRNTFAGIDDRFAETVGAALTPVHTTHNRLEIDLGATYIEEGFADTITASAATPSNYPAARGAFIYQYNFTKDTYLQESFEDLTDVDRVSNTLINSKSSLVAPISKHIAIKVSYEIRFANVPPPGFKTTDRLLTTDLQFNF
jgi:putative salt-induced outer membrane protein YdiY